MKEKEVEIKKIESFKEFNEIAGSLQIILIKYKFFTLLKKQKNLEKDNIRRV